MEPLPCLLSGFSPLPGVIKTDYTDFVVEELPLYPADGVGTHTFFLLEKAGLSTMQAAQDVAAALNVHRRAIGFAGQKDARAVTRQWMSVEHVEVERVLAIDRPRLRVLQATRHGNKLRLGHLRGNRFQIRVRNAAPERLPELENALAELARRGVPNYFGVQRFGYRGDTWRIGRALVCGAADEAVDLILGLPTDADVGRTRRARELYTQGQYLEAAAAWPRMFHAERRALKVLARAGGRKGKALAAMDRRLREFYVSAYQSHLFNQVVAARLAHGLDRLWDGDLAWLHASGAVFHVADAVVEQPRADCFDISPTGPLFGRRMTQPGGRAQVLETTIRAAEGLPAGAFDGPPYRAHGGRRPLRHRPGEPAASLGADERGPYLELRFVLPRGCYATALLRELFQVEVVAQAAPDGEPTESEPD